MKALRFIFCQQGGNIHIGNDTFAFPANYFVVTDTNAKVSAAGTDFYCFDFHAGDLQDLAHDVADLLDKTPQQLFHRDSMRQIKANEQMIRVLHLLANDPAALLRFVYVYCLGHDRRYFSALLQQSIAGDQPFFDFIEAHALSSWSLPRFAEELGLPLRKFNMLFQEKFGTSAKHWLLVRRLKHARELLLSTSMRVFDIAAECGFSNHAHFTGSFRRYFHYSPSEARMPVASGPCERRRPAGTAALATQSVSP